jgi:dihydrofolate reductase
MAKLKYTTNMSLDGYIEDRHGAFDFGPMDDELFAAYIDLVGSVGTFLYGRRLYETMAGWETTSALAAQSPLAADFANAWKAPRKIVYSTTLATVPTANTYIERAFDVGAGQQLKVDASRDITVGGANLASRPSARASSTNASCSSGRSSWGAASLPFRSTPATASSSSMSAASPTGSCFSAIAHGGIEHGSRQ